MGRQRFTVESIIRKLREAEVELARLSGVDQSLISRYLRSDQRARLPRLKNLVALAKARLTSNSR